jgi:hypothetical protein
MLTPSGKSSSNRTQPTPPPNGSQSARLQGRYGGKGKHVTPSKRGGRKIITRPSQRNTKIDAWETNKKGDIVNSNNGSSTVLSESSSSDSKQSDKMSPTKINYQDDQSPGKNDTRLPRHINRNISKSVIAAIDFAKEDHDDVARQATTELENRLNEITGDEIKAATSLMRKMRKKCDWYHLEIKKKKIVLNDLQKQVVRLQQKTENNDGHRGALRRRAQVLKKTLQSLSKEYETQQMNMKIYNHMSKRLMKMVKTTDKQMTDVQRDLQQVTKKHKEMEVLHQKLRNRKSNLTQTKGQLRKKLQDYQERRTQALLKIERVIQESQLETQLIKDHVRTAENNRLGGNRTERMTRLFATKKQANAQMPKEFRDQSQRMQKLEEAFSKIRNSTGLTDVNEIVEKFLSRDEKYEQLCNAADEARHKIENLKKEKDEVQTAIAEFQGSSKNRSIGNRDLYRDVDKYDQMLTETTRKHYEAKEKSTRVRLLLEETRITVGRFLKTLNKFGDSSLIDSEDSSRFVPSISSLPKALQNVKSQVSVMLEQLSQLLIEERSQSGSRPGTRDAMAASGLTFMTSVPGNNSEEPEFQSNQILNNGDNKKKKKTKKSKQQHEGDMKGDNEIEDTSDLVYSNDEMSDDEGAKEKNVSFISDDPSPISISKVLDNPKADRLIFESLMSAVPDLSNQNLRIDRERSRFIQEDSAVAHLLGIELPIISEDQDYHGGEHDVSGIPHEEDPGITRPSRGWDATLPKHDHTALLERFNIKHLSKHLVDRQRRKHMKETAEIEKKIKEQEEREKKRFEAGKDDGDWYK